MKITAENFRQLDRKWIKINKPNEAQKIEAASGAKLAGDFYLGHAYIDHFLGLSAILVGSAKESNVGVITSYDIKNLEENLAELHVDFLEQIDLDVEIIEKKDINKTLAYIIESYINENAYLPFLENQKYIFESRQEEQLDEFREPFFPDIIKFTVARKGLIDEEIYGRIEDLDEDSQDLIVTILNNPLDKKHSFHIGDLAKVNYLKNDIYSGLVCLDIIPYSEGKVKYNYVIDPRDDFEIDHVKLIEYAKSKNVKLTDLTKEEIDSFRK